MKRVAVLGDGAWGTALATVLAHNGHHITLWCKNIQVAQAIKTSGINSIYLPEVPLAHSIQPTTDLRQAVVDCEWIFEAIPVKYLRATLEEIKPFYQKNQRWVLLSKGIEEKSLLFPSQIVDDLFGDTVAKAVISGPSFAYELARKQHTAVDMACMQPWRQELLELLSNDYLHVRLTDDLNGAEIGGAFKNVIALAMGMLEAADVGDNAKAWLMTQAFQEIKHIAITLGAQEKTIDGLSGIGDLMLTCYGKHSKNRTFGKQLIAKTFDSTKELPESLNTIKAINDLIQKYELNVPLFSAIYDVVHNGKSVTTILRSLR